MNVFAGVKSDVGRMRSGNEDAYISDAPVFGVADGMGGHVAGDVASSTAIDTIRQNLASLSAADPESLADLLRAANGAVWDKARADAGLQGMGTTCTIAFINDTRAHIAHVGDSRAYRLRDGRLEQLTEDHTLVARMVREGKIQPQEAEHHPQRNVITRVLGVEPEVSVDLATIELATGDRLLLCSDGLTSMLRHDDVEDILARESDPQAAADMLVELANEAGGEDNITVIVIDVVDDEGASRATASDDGAARDHTAEDHTDAPAPRRGRLRWVVAVLIVVVLAGASWGAARFVLANSWFVGVDESGRVAIYSGIPEEIAGFELKRKREVTATSLADLPAFLRADVEEGIKVDTLAQAHETVGNLSDRAQDFETRDGDRRTSAN